MSVDTYLQGKRGLDQYARVEHDGVEILLAPRLAAEAGHVELATTRFLLWRRLVAAAQPRAEHFHSPACRH